MALSIKDPETDRLARALAEATGESITEAIRRALEERLTRVAPHALPTISSAMTNTAYRADESWSSIRPHWSPSC